ncbi:carbon starvation protein A [Candidatus Omnitrophota bacterium]
MNSIFIIIIALAAFFWAYKVYAKKLETIWQINPANSVPSKAKYDGVDFVPAKNWLVLLGHHFSSIAGAGPIVGPVIACCIWGWGPVLLWVIIGTIFFGAVHDFGALAVSVREGGCSIANVASKVISKRAYYIFGIFVLLALILVIAVFLYLCADTFVKESKIVLPSLGLIPVAIFTGFLLYRRKMNQVGATGIGLGLLVLLVILGQKFFPTGISFNQWVIVLLIYSFCASILPVNILLQPRDYLSSFLLFFGMIMGFLGLLISRPSMELPAFISYNSSQGSLWPMLFVIVACGAISGFHCLISSGTSSKQINNERDIKKIGYGAMLLEGLLAVLVILAIGAGLGKQCLIDKSSPVVIFGKGYGEISRSVLGGFGGVLAIIILNAFILTTLDTATRITRYIAEEFFKIKNRYISTFIVVALGGWLALAKDSLNTPLWKKLWPAFGASNQLVAALALFVISCWLLSKNIPPTPSAGGIPQRTKFACGKPYRLTLYPAIFMLITTLAALAYQFSNHLKNGDYLLLGITSLLVVLALVMTFEVIGVFRKKKSGLTA